MMYLTPEDAVRVLPRYQLALEENSKLVSQLKRQLIIDGWTWEQIDAQRTKAEDETELTLF